MWRTLNVKTWVMGIAMILTILVLVSAEALAKRDWSWATAVCSDLANSAMRPDMNLAFGQASLSNNLLHFFQSHRGKLKARIGLVGQVTGLSSFRIIAVQNPSPGSYLLTCNMRHQRGLVTWQWHINYEVRSPKAQSVTYLVLPSSDSIYRW